MTEEEVLQLRKENQELREAPKQMQELLRMALARIEELEKQKTPPPAFVKADVKKPVPEEKQPTARSGLPSTTKLVADRCRRRSWSIIWLSARTVIFVWVGSAWLVAEK
jgi:aspartate/methionine/tyrosine aminotransferase